MTVAELIAELQKMPSEARVDSEAERLFEGGQITAIELRDYKADNGDEIVVVWWL